MRSPLLIAVAAVGGLMAAAGSASAQGLAEEEGELQEARFELEDARRELEEAAREVARLSAQLAAPMVGEVVRQFRLTGRRAMLGISISDGEEGVRVDGVTPGGPAAASGVVQFVTPAQIITNLTAPTAELLSTQISLLIHFIPEPGLLLLLGSGVAGLAILGRKRMRS